MTTTKEIRAAVFVRAGGWCECKCGRRLTENSQLDHAFGRSRAPESVATTWALRIECHDQKTQNRPSAAHWLKRFGEHCKRYGFTAELELARAKYLTLRAKGLAP
jgi:hypothetical protein